MLTFGDPADVEGLFHRHFDAMAEDQRDLTERQKRINIIQILNSHLQPFRIQMANLIDLPAFIGDALGSFREFSFDADPKDQEMELCMIMPGGGPFKLGAG